jgi:hypothetical protein
VNRSPNNAPSLGGRVRDVRSPAPGGPFKWGPLGHPRKLLSDVITVRIATAQFDLNLATFMIANRLLRNQTRAVNIVVVIAPGVIVGSTSNSGAAFNTASGWRSGTTLTIINFGRIQGRGGDGGSGGGASSVGGIGGDGGPALSIQLNATILNTLGQIWGGGGGSAGGNGTNGSPGGTGGGGGGGAGTLGGNGGLGFGNGSPGTSEAGGAGGAGQQGTPNGGAPAGGSGAGPGLPGAASINNGPGTSPGGAAGKAINLNSNRLTIIGGSAPNVLGPVS